MTLATEGQPEPYTIIYRSVGQPEPGTLILRPAGQDSGALHRWKRPAGKPEP